MCTRLFHILVLAQLFLVACGQVEYPSKLSPDKAVTQDITQYALTFPEIMEFSEGKFMEYVIAGSVPEGGVPILTAENLPKGVQFNPSTGRISWTPEIGILEGKAYKQYRITLTLTSSTNPDLKLNRSAVLMVIGAQR